MMWFLFNRVLDIFCDYKVTKILGIFVFWVFKVYVGLVRGLWMRVKLKEGLVLICE